MRTIREIKTDLNQCDYKLFELAKTGKTLLINDNGTISTSIDLLLCKDLLQRELITVLEAIKGELEASLGVNKAA